MDLIAKAGGEAIFAKANVGESAEVRAAIDATVAKWGRIDVIVNDAAMMTFSPLIDLPEGDWDRVMGVNLRSVFLFCKYGVPHMPEGAAIVNISSVHAHETTKNVVPYATSKGGMEAFTRGFSEELADRKIRINCVAPGAVDTPMLWDNPNVKNGTEKGGGRHRQARGSGGGHLLPGGGGSALHHGHDAGGRRRAAGHFVSGAVWFLRFGLLPVVGRALRLPDPGVKIVAGGAPALQPEGFGGPTGRFDIARQEDTTGEVFIPQRSTLHGQRPFFSFGQPS